MESVLFERIRSAIVLRQRWLDRCMAIAGVVNVLAVISQISAILEARSAAGQSLATYAGFMFIQLTYVAAGTVHRDLRQIVGMLASFAATVILAAIILYYRHFA